MNVSTDVRFGTRLAAVSGDNIETSPFGSRL